MYFMHGEAPSAGLPIVEPLASHAEIDNNIIITPIQLIYLCIMMISSLVYYHGL